MKNKPAFPNQRHRDDVNFKHFEGLTKRELFAAMAMQGELGAQWQNQYSQSTYGPTNADDLAKICVAYADALIAALEKDQEDK